MVMDSLDELSPLERFIHQNKNGGENMNVFKKIFGSVKPAIAGDAAVVSALLQSIAVGADPKIQVQKIRDIIGDSDATFKEYLGELEMAGDEKPEVIAKAVDIVDNYYKEHLAGDESKACPKCGKEPCECDKAGDEEKPADDKATKKPEAGDEEKPAEKPEAGDACGKSMGDAIDYDLLADKVVEKMQAKVQDKPEDTAGDEKSTAIETELGMPMNGDSKDEVHGSDDFMKDIWG